MSEKCPCKDFEAEAERFRQATGYLAPGKSQAAAMQGSPSDDERRGAWDVWQKVSPRLADLQRQLAQAKEVNNCLRTMVQDAIPVLEAAAKETPQCLGMVAPPVDWDGIPECEPWPVIEEMLANFREALPTGQAGAQAAEKKL